MSVAERRAVTVTDAAKSTKFEEVLRGGSFDAGYFTCQLICVRCFDGGALPDLLCVLYTSVEIVTGNPTVISHW